MESERAKARMSGVIFAAPYIAKDTNFYTIVPEGSLKILLYVHYKNLMIT